MNSVAEYRFDDVAGFNLGATLMQLERWYEAQPDSFPADMTEAARDELADKCRAVEGLGEILVMALAHPEEVPRICLDVIVRDSEGCPSYDPSEPRMVELRELLQRQKLELRESIRLMRDWAAMVRRWRRRLSLAGSCQQRRRSLR